MHKSKTHSDAECLKQRKSEETAQTNTAVAVTSAADATVGGVRCMDYDDDRYAPGERNFADRFLYTVEQDDTSMQPTNEHQVTTITDTADPYSGLKTFTFDLGESVADGVYGIS